MSTINQHKIGIEIEFLPSTDVLEQFKTSSENFYTRMVMDEFDNIVSISQATSRSSWITNTIVADNVSDYVLDIINSGEQGCKKFIQKHFHPDMEKEYKEGANTHGCIAALIRSIQLPDKHFWRVTKDGDYIELISKITSIDELVDTEVLLRTVDHLVTKYDVVFTGDQSLHVHVDVTDLNYNINKYLKLLKLFNEDIVHRIITPDRHKYLNTYAKPTSYVINLINEIKQKHPTIYGKKLYTKCYNSLERDYGINFKSIQLHNTIEYRYCGADTLTHVHPNDVLFVIKYMIAAVISAGYECKIPGFGEYS